MLEGSILKQLDNNHRHSDRPIRFGVYYKNTLVALCHALEDHLLIDDSDALVITAFQQGKWYLQEAERYADIAGKVSHISILAAPDTGWAEHPTSQLPNVDLVGIESSDPVAQEWHLIILSSQYTAMVICQELSEADYGVGGQPEADAPSAVGNNWISMPSNDSSTACAAFLSLKIKSGPRLSAMTSNS